MQAAKQQQPWKINIYAKCENFNFRFKATRTLPFTSSSTFHRLSILLRLHKFLLQVKSESPIQQRPTLKSKLIRAFEKFLPRLTKKQSVVAQDPETKSPIDRLRRLAYEEPACTGSLAVGIVAFLFQSISEKDGKGIIVLGSVVLLYFALLFKKYITGKSTAALAFSVVCSLPFCFGAFMNYDQVQGYIAKFAWKTWKYMCH